jgi:hypothetical protein
LLVVYNFVPFAHPQYRTVREACLSVGWPSFVGRVAISRRFFAASPPQGVLRSRRNGTPGSSLGREQAEAGGARGDAERAARLFGVVETLRWTLGVDQHPEERALREPYLAAARSQLYEAAWKAGQAMTMEEAVAYALEAGADD